MPFLHYKDFRIHAAHWMLPISHAGQWQKTRGASLSKPSGTGKTILLEFRIFKVLSRAILKALEGRIRPARRIFDIPAVERFKMLVVAIHCLLIVQDFRRVPKFKMKYNRGH